MTETLNGRWEPTPVHPIDENGKWLWRPEHFTSRIIRADCGGFYGSEVRNFTSQYRRTIFVPIEVDGRSS